MGHWIDACIHSLLTKWSEPTEQPEVGIQNDKLAEIFTNTGTVPSPTYSEAVYEKMDLLKIVTCNGINLAPEQRTQLFQVLIANQAAFQGRKGEYTGGAVRLISKPKAMPWQAKPYPVPLKNREILEGKFQWQCKIKAMRRLTPEEFEAREWAFPTFGIPKKNGTIRVIINFCRLNAKLICREYPLWTTEEILTSVHGFLFVTSLNLNMGYLSIPVNEATHTILMIDAFRGV